MVDETLPHEDGRAVTPPELAGGPGTSDDLPQPSVIRTRVIPVFAGVLLVGIIGLILWSMFAPESARQQTSRQIGGAIVLDNPRAIDNFSLTPLGGGEVVNLVDFRGKTVVVNFWATWCQPCIREIPILMQATREFDENTVMVGINTMDESSDAVAMMDEFGINYLVLDDNDRRQGAVAVDFGLVGIPETYVINAEGEIVAYRRGDFASTQDVHALVAFAQ